MKKISRPKFRYNLLRQADVEVRKFPEIAEPASPRVLYVPGPIIYKDIYETVTLADQGIARSLTPKVISYDEFLKYREDYLHFDLIN